jgi:type IV pilus assembly protein PilV
MTHLRRYGNGRGFTLVEVMVTLFIIGIGALGVAGLQLAAMRSNQSAFLRSQATLAAYALVDRMRAEAAIFAGESFNTKDILEIDPAASTPAKASFYAWAKELEASPLQAASDEGSDELLPLGELDCRDNSACNTGHCRILIRWDDSRGEDEALAPEARETGALAFDLCARLPQ